MHGHGGMEAQSSESLLSLVHRDDATTPAQAQGPLVPHCLEGPQGELARQSRGGCSVSRTAGRSSLGKERNGLELDMPAYKWAPHGGWSTSTFLSTSAGHVAKTTLQNQGKGLNKRFCEVEGVKYPVL